MRTCVIIILQAVLYCHAIKWNTVLVKLKGPAHAISYVKVPLTAEDAILKGWYQTDHSIELPVQKFCSGPYGLDQSFCTLYDLYGTFAGFEVSVLAKDMDGRLTPYVYTKYPVIRRTEYLGDVYYSTAILTVDMDTLEYGGRKFDGVTGNGVWYLEGKNRIKRIPITTTSIDKQKIYKKQKCVPGLGQNYYHNFTEDMQCEYFYPLYVITDTKDAIGVGYNVFGETDPVYKSKWFEQITSANEISENVAECFENFVEEYGVISLRVYFVEKPWNTKCPT